ncbi:LemA family protein [bacterium]|nr:LemA family protein [bacterium]
MSTEKNNSSKMWLIIGAVVVVLAMWGIGSYNGLVTMGAAADNAWAQVENNLQRRSDLIPNLVETVKGYANHEEEVFTAIADARAKLAGATTVDETTVAASEMEGALSRLLAISENYPELKSNENFMKLQDELAGTENRLATARKDYNDAVTAYNVKIRSIPTNIIAGLMGAQAKSLFTITEAAAANPQVSFQ